ncbi:unnamed protein product [Cercopithifilaria johnstoni]|uniref:Uncharacterized protein n=1 Tax=Cercopithifilaria johnstoni TaxID=2874296 RepID=A0A8J2M0P3_9BILA|nr:unnamed protein product [Cercopithifilaria johnstoni]
MSKTSQPSVSSKDSRNTAKDDTTSITWLALIVVGMGDKLRMRGVCYVDTHQCVGVHFTPVFKSYLLVQACYSI